jgi:predicted RNA-binding protein with EMAP domain
MLIDSATSVKEGSLIAVAFTYPQLFACALGEGMDSKRIHLG